MLGENGFLALFEVYEHRSMPFPRMELEPREGWVVAIERIEELSRKNGSPEWDASFIKCLRWFYAPPAIDLT